MANPNDPRRGTEWKPALYVSRGLSGGGITPRLGTSSGEIARPGPSVPGLSRFRPTFRLRDNRDVPAPAAAVSGDVFYPDRPVGYGIGWGIGSGLS